MSPIAWMAYNPTAGRYPSRLLAERAARVLRRNGWQVSLAQTTSGEHLTQMASQAAESGADAFFVAGGDGSVNLALSGLAGTETALAVLPAGTSNVWAREQGLPGLTWTRWLALEESARQLAHGRVQRVDVGMCRGRPFLLWSGVGLDGFIVHRIEPRKPWEKHFSVLQYAAAAAVHLPEWRGIHLQGEADGEAIDGRFIMAVVSNIRLYAGGLAELSPQAQLDDGVMDLWLFAGDSPLDAARHALDLWAGRHQHSDKARRKTCRRLRLHSEVCMYLQMDGEPVHVEHELSLEVVPRSLRVLVPETMPASRFLHPPEKVYGSWQV